MTDTPPDISPHDRRVRVFVSSTLIELAAEREAAKAAITALRLTPVMFELGARPHPPRELYRSYLAQSDVFVGIYGDRYGWIAPDMEISGLEDEYLLSGGRPKLLYIKTPAPDRDERLTAMIERIWGDGDASTSPYRDADDLRERLADDLAVLLTERFDAVAPSAGSLEPVPLPMPATPLIGRERELAQVIGLLERPDVRILTVLGPGGIGKTRLAVEVALALRDLRTTAPSPAAGSRLTCFVDLAPVSDAAGVPGAVAAALGVRTEGTRPVLDVLVDRIGERPVLLVLDNFEHVLGAAADVARLVAACPRLQVLVTSRSVLHVRGEHEVLLAPLGVPPAGRTDLDAVAAAPAVQVFVERARQVRPDFELDPDNAPSVAELVDRLEGIPLAIELAAARVRLLSPEALVRRLCSQLDLRSQDVDRPSRQQTLRTTIEWSYDLLDERERRLLQRLSVFVGGWSMEAAEAVGAGGDGPDGDTSSGISGDMSGDMSGDTDVLETLSSLVSHSLVSPGDAGRGEPRFRMLEAVRAYAAEQLELSGRRDATMHRLTTFLCELTTRAGEALGTPRSRRWLERVDADLDTLRAGLRWAIERDDAPLAIRLTAPLTRFWWRRGLLGEMLEVAERTAELPSAADLTASEAALLLWTRGTIRIALGRTEEALPLVTALVAEARRLGDDRLLAQGLFSLALATPPDAAQGGHPDGTHPGGGTARTEAERRAADAAWGSAATRMQAMLEEALGIFRRLGDDWGVSLVLTPLGDLALLAGDAATAVRMHEEALERALRIDDDHMQAQAYDQLALDALMTLDIPAALSRLASAAGIHQRLRDQEGIGYCLEGLAGVMLASGDAALAARLLAAAERSRAVVGVAVWPFLRPLHDRLVDLVRSALPADAFAREFEAGAALDPVEALDIGLTASAQVAAASPPSA